MNSSLAEIFVSILMAGLMIWIIGKYLDIFLVRKKWQIWSFLMWGMYFVYQFYAECRKGNGSAFMLLLNVGDRFKFCVNSKN